MSKLELKGNILELIAKLNDKESLEELTRIVNEFVGNHEKDTDFADEMSSTELSNLNSSIKESKDKKNLVDHKAVIKGFKR